MMKRFEKSGKIVGLVLLAMGLVFAGCASPDGSSEGSAPYDTQGYTSVPITVAPDGDGASLTIGDGGLSEVAVFNGHTVEIHNGSTSISGGVGRCTGAAGDVQCWVKVINRDSDESMANVYLNGDGCTVCTTAMMDNADFIAPGNTTKPIGGADVSVPINGMGFTFVEDGRFVAGTKPFNEYGGPTYPIQASIKPYQLLHPQCGQKSQMWDFGNQIPRYTFFAVVDADYFPWNPVGPDGAPGGGDDDPRYDFTNYTTVYLMLCDTANVTVGGNYYRRGSWKRSNVLAGYGSPGNVSGINLTPGSYFYVNVGIEYPDKMETTSMGDANNFPATGYHYYTQYSVIFTYNPNVIERVRIQNAGLFKFVGGQVPCRTAGICSGPNTQAYQMLDDIVDASNSVYGPGYIYFYRGIRFNFNSYSATTAYHTDNGGAITIGAGNVQIGGQRGVAHFNLAYLGGSITAGNANGVTHEGADSDPEQTPNVYNFYVKGVAGDNAGNGSYIRVDNFTSFTQFNYAHTALTLFPSGNKGGTDDWLDFCAFPLATPAVKYDPFPGSHYCDPGKTQAQYAIYQQVENQSPGIGQGGEGLRGGVGGIQSWSVYVCVQ